MGQRRPNVMLVMSDQQRADFLVSEGFGVDTMPFFESLFGDGVRFPAAYTSIPLCIPARISLLTGRFAKSHGVTANWANPAPRYGRDLADVVRDEGYEIALFGKNHTHHTGEGWDVWRTYGHEFGPARPENEQLDVEFNRWVADLGHWISEEPTPFPIECQYPVRIVSDASEWLRDRHGRRDDKPFFAIVSCPEPHAPYQVPEPYFSLFPPELVPPIVERSVIDRKNMQWRSQYETIRHFHPKLDEEIGRLRSLYCGMLRLIDDQMRRLISVLHETDEIENTIVLILSDHGELCGDYGMVRKGLGLPQVSIRIPMLWFGGPITARAREHSAMVSIVDVFPTICEALGVEIPHGVQGRSLWPLLVGEDECPEEFRSVYIEQGVGGKVIYPDPEGSGPHSSDVLTVHGVPRTNYDATRVATSGARRAVVRGQWKLIYDLDLPMELYDLASDPYEVNNQVDDPHLQQVVKQLLEELLWWSIRLDDTLELKRYKPAAHSHNWHRSSGVVRVSDVYGESSAPGDGAF